MYLNEKFKTDFKKESRRKQMDFSSKLSKVFDLPDYHFAKSVLSIFYEKYPKIDFDRKIASKILQDLINTGGFSFFDYSQEFRGGYPIYKLKKNYYNKESKSLTSEVENSNWSSFLDKIKSEYWKKESKMESFLLLQNFDLYKDREPKTVREKTLQSITVNGINVSYNFFNITKVVNFYTKLFKEFFHDFELIEKISNTRIKRYRKEIGDGFFLALCVDYGLLKKELKMGYLEFPRISVELFSSKLKSHIKPNEYVISQNKYDIGRVNFHYYIANKFNNFRVGNSSQNDEVLKRDLFFHMEVNAYYLRIYLEEVERIVSVVTPRAKTAKKRH